MSDLVTDKRIKKLESEKENKMPEEIEVTEILIKIRKEEVISLTVAEIRGLQKVLDDLLGAKNDPQPYFVPYCPTCPPCQPYRRWEVTWGNTGEFKDNNVVICSLSDSLD